jgi:glyoxylase-like metal-dependent hydrolase (beta-lactamase superfamily II)
MKIVQLSIPTPFYVGDVNVYLIREDPITLIDVGPKTTEASEALRRGLAAHGVKFSDVQRIVLTHAHEDHCGLAKQVRDDAKNADIYLHKWERGHLTGRLSRESSRKLLLRSGVPEAVFNEMRSLYDEISLLTDSLVDSDLKPLNDGDELGFANGVIKILHTPGHTPGSCSFIREADRTLICGDCVLKRITPNPILSADPVDPDRRFPSLAEYLVSLARLRELRPTLTLGGHGEPVTDFDEVFNRYVRGIDERQKRVISLIAPGGSTAFEVAQVLFPNASNAEVHRFLAVSEAVAHLDYAKSERKIAVELNNDVEVYRKK